MKLSEIINALHIPREMSVDEIAEKKKSLANGTFVANVTSTTTLRRIGKTYALVKNDEVLGWLELGDEVELFGTVYDVIKMIYIVPELRSTLTGGAFLVALKNYTEHPLILGSDEYGGVLFKDGKKLVSALNKSSRNFVSLFNPKTGQKFELGNEIPFRPSHLTLVFENNTFPLKHLWFYLYEDCETRPFSIEGDL